MASPQKPPVVESASPVKEESPVSSDQSESTTGTDKPVTGTGDTVVAEFAPGKAVVADPDDDLLSRAQVKAPHLTAEFCDEHGLTDDDLEDIASGAVSPPPYHGPDFSDVDFRRTPGGWQTTPSGVAPGDTNAISR